LKTDTLRRNPVTSETYLICDNRANPPAHRLPWPMPDYKGDSF